MSKRSVTIILLIVILLFGAGGAYYFTQVQPESNDQPQNKNKVAESGSGGNSEQDKDQEQKQQEPDKSSPESTGENSLDRKIEEALDVSNYSGCQDCSSGNKKIYNGVAIGRSNESLYGAPSPESETTWEFRKVPQTLFIEVKEDAEGKILGKKEIRVEDIRINDSVALVALQKSTAATPTAMLVKRIVEAEE